MFMENKMKIPEVGKFRVRNEIILLLGTEPQGGYVMQRALEAVGYPVLTADSREQADELFRSFNGAIRLLILDIAEKEKSGLEVIAALRKSNPTLKVIVASKDVSPRERHDIYISGVTELVRKPVDKEQLLRVVRRIVEK
jgi:two-component system cell cycle sensor histidine kinase/response regulator CckA